MQCIGMDGVGKGHYYPLPPSFYLVQIYQYRWKTPLDTVVVVGIVLHILSSLTHCYAHTPPPMRPFNTLLSFFWCTLSLLFGVTVLVGIFLYLRSSLLCTVNRSSSFLCLSFTLLLWYFFLVIRTIICCQSACLDDPVIIIHTVPARSGNEYFTEM